MKQKMFRIYNFTANEIGEKVIFTEEQLKEREIRLAYNFLFDTYCKYKKIEFKNDILIEGIIKVMLDENYFTALGQCMKGIIVNKKKYRPFISTPAMMKKEDRKTGGKCEMYFIQEEDKSFRRNFEELISLKRITPIVKSSEVDENTPTVAINKDILARVSLTTSSSYKVKLKPRICIVDNPTYTYLADYVSVDDKMQLHEHKAGTLDSRYYEHEAFDGCGLMTPSFADAIAKELEMDYKLDWCGIRLYNGTATKGLLTRIDFVEYFREYANTYTIKDIYGNNHDVREIDCIINCSMAKWAKNFKSMEDLQANMDKIPPFYKDDMEYIYITKTNKREPRLYTLSNYQLMSNLALKFNDYKEMGKLTEEIYQKVCDKDLETIKFLLGDIVKNGVGEDDEDIDINMSTKAHALLNLDSDFLKLGVVDNAIRKMIISKVNTLATGKMYLKGHYKVACADPIAQLNYLINGQLHNEYSLKEREYFIPHNANKKLVISRNPLNSFSEVQKIETTTNEVYEKYLGELTEEILVFNQVDDTAMLCSGEDFDTDVNFVVDNEIIYNAVIEPENNTHFINLEDDKDASKKLPYTLSNRWIATLLASGNLIGSLSNMGMKINAQASEKGYINVISGEEVMYMDIKEALEKKGVNKETWKFIQEKIEEGKLIEVEDYYTQEEFKEYISKKFYEKKNLSYFTTRLQMKAIDAPKTLNFPSKDDYAELQEMLPQRKPKFMQFVKVKAGQDKLTKDDVLNTNTALNNYASYIARNLMPKVYEKGKDNVAILHNAINVDVENIDIDLFEEVEQQIREFYEFRETKRSDISKRFEGDKGEKSRHYNMLEVALSDYAEAIVQKFDPNYILKVLAKGRRINKEGNATTGYPSSIIVKYFFTIVFDYLKATHCAEGWKFEECSIEESQFEMLGKHCKKVAANLNRKDVVKMERQNKVNVARKTGDLIDSRIGLTVDVDSIPERLFVKVTEYKGKENVVLVNNKENQVAYFYPDKRDVDTFTKIKDVTEFKLVDINESKNGRSANVQLLIVS